MQHHQSNSDFAKGTIRALIVISCLCLVGCQHTQQPSITPLPAPRNASALLQTLEPDIAGKEAEDYVSHLPSNMVSSERKEIVSDFEGAFFSGFTNPDGGLIGSKAAEHGFQAGQNFRRHCDEKKVKQIMEAYGYTAIEAIGTWSVHFESSRFCPQNAPKESWWLDYFGNLEWNVSTTNKQANKPVLYQISGYLSPKGEYGHMGGYDHEFYATKISSLKNGK